VTEPTTFATDVLLAILATVLGIRLLRGGDRWWGAAFLAVASGSLAGGVYHGFTDVLPSQVNGALWFLTGLSIAAASMLYLTGADRRLLPLAAAKFVAFVGWFTWNDDFRWILVDYGITFVAVALILRTRWIFGALVVSVLAAVVQQSGFSLHRHFNHNDLYHLIQMVALWLLYRAALTRARGRSTNPPR
jgi:hypothetical protein